MRSAIPYYHNIFTFAVFEWPLIYDDKTECSFGYAIYFRFYYKNSTKEGGNCEALQLEGRQTSRILGFN